MISALDTSRSMPAPQEAGMAPALVGELACRCDHSENKVDNPNDSTDIGGQAKPTG